MKVRDLIELLQDMDEAAEALKHDDSKPKVVYLSEGSQIGYLPGAASAALGW